MIGKILMGILLAFACLLLIAVVRTLVRKAPERKERKPVSRNPEELQKMGRDFARLIRVETVSRREDEDLSQFSRLQEEIDSLFPLCREKLEKHVVTGVLLYRWKGRDSQKLPILLMGHQDVVPADPAGWKYPPFAGEIHDGILWGRGTMDDKCSIFCQMSAVEGLLQDGFVPPCDVWLEYSINEEISGRGAPRAVQWFKEHGIREFAFVWDEGGAVVDKAMAGMDRPYAVIGITEKGYADVKITAKGEGGHSAAPKAQSTVTRLAAFITEVNRKKPFQKTFTPHVRAMLENMAPSFGFGMRLLMGNLWLFAPLLKAVMPKVSSQAGALLGTTCAFTMMEGSSAPNVIPSEAHVVANLRIGYTQDLQESLEVLKRIGKKYDLEFEVLTGREASPVTPVDSEIFRYLTECIHVQFPDCGVSPYVMTGGTDCRHYSGLSRNCLRFYPVRLTSAQLAAMHSVNENVSLDAISDAIDFYRYVLAHYAA